MATPKATVTVSNPPRGPGAQPTFTFEVQSFKGSFAWGSEPGQAIIIYVPTSPQNLDLSLAQGIATGALVTIQMGVHYFCGVCRSDTVVTGSSGSTRTLEFQDLRYYLQWDYVTCAFNMPDRRLVNGVWVKRWWHIYPSDFATGTKTFTNAPLLAWQIISALFSAPTVETPWAWNLTGNGLFPQGVLNYPVFGFDCLNGKRLDAALNEISDKGGVIFGLDSLPGAAFRLVWTRKGYGLLPFALWPTGSDGQRVGVSLSKNATNIQILGERNKYQVNGVPMVQDWATAWEEFLDIDELAMDLFNNEKDPISGNAYNAYPGDTEHWQGWGDAKVRALQITVRQYVTLRNTRDGGGTPFADYRKFSNRSRMDMPAALYIQTLLFRAFMPDPNWNLKNVAGRTIPPESADLADQLLCLTQFDPVKGTFTSDPTQPVDGNGIFIAQGFSIGEELFQLVQPDRINANFFNGANKIWSSVQFQIDDSAEQRRFIVTDTPVFTSNNLLTTINGQTVLNANFTLEVPSATAALVFDAERFQYGEGTPGRNRVEYVSGLNEEYVGPLGSYQRILYASGLTAAQEANFIAQSLLLCQYVYLEGGMRLAWNPKNSVNTFGVWPANGIGSLIDRVEVEYSPKGIMEIVDFTSERQRDHFEPERDLERRTIQNALFPGQQELRQQTLDQKRLNAAVKSTPQFLFGLFMKLLKGEASGDLYPTKFVGAPNGNLNCGTPLFKTPAATVAKHPTQLASGDNVFVGVTVRDQENNQTVFRVQQSGNALARVQGPIAVNDPIGQAPMQDQNGKATNADYFIATTSGNPACGVAMQAITDSSTQLIPVALAQSALDDENNWNYRGLYQQTDDYGIFDVVQFGAGINSGGYLSTVPNNTTNPQTGPGWVQVYSAAGVWV